MIDFDDLDRRSKLLPRNGTVARSSTFERCFGHQTTIVYGDIFRWFRDVFGSVNTKTAQLADLDTANVPRAHMWFHN